MLLEVIFILYHLPVARTELLTVSSGDANDLFMAERNPFSPGNCGPVCENAGTERQKRIILMKVLRMIILQVFPPEGDIAIIKSKIERFKSTIIIALLFNKIIDLQLKTIV